MLLKKISVKGMRKSLILSLAFLLMVSSLVIVPEAQASANYNQTVPFDKVTGKIAVIDTGVAWDHPSLANINAHYWRNMINNSNDVADRHGHGTQVLGLLAARAGYGASTGLLPNAQYIILKALNDQGEADDYILAQSIVRAVDYGARVIVLSLGISVDSLFLADAIDYAYQNNVLIVAAAGNNNKQAQFPAAYSKVLSVGSVNANGAVSAFNPAGYEVGVLAHGENVTVLNRTGGTKSASGSSMAVPMVAAMAMNIFHYNSNATVAEVMNHIQVNASNNGSWYTSSAYGQVDYRNAGTNYSILQSLVAANNTSLARSYNIPRTGALATRINNDSQYKWYRIAAGDAGTVTMTYSSNSNRYVQIEVMDTSQRVLKSAWLNGSGQKFSFAVGTGTTLIRISSDATNTPVTAGFHLDYRIGADIWEGNNNTTNAKQIPLRARTEANLHAYADQDWYYVDVTEYGTLSVDVTNVPEHMDAVLYIRQGTNSATSVDQRAAAMNESYSQYAMPGRYYIGVTDYNRNSVNYSYQLNVSFRPGGQIRYTDISYSWARVDIQALYNKSILQEAFAQTRFYPDRYITRAEYASLIVSSLRLALPTTNAKSYSDVAANHWANQAIYVAKANTLIAGYPDGTFKPDMPITRAEIATLTYNAYRAKISASTTNNFNDVYSTYWANREISSMARSGILQGYPDGLFRPNNYTTRAEAVAILARLVDD